MVDNSRLTVISSGRSELEEVEVIYALYYQRFRFRYKRTCSIAFLRIAEPEERVE